MIELKQVTGEGANELLAGANRTMIELKRNRSMMFFPDHTVLIEL